MWVSGNVELTVLDGRKQLVISQLDTHHGDRLPSGDQVNPVLAHPKSALRVEALRVIQDGGKVSLGRMRVMSGGGFYRLPARLLDVSCRMGSHERIWEKICGKMGGEPEHAYTAVFRDWGAPGTWGVIEGGGSGRGVQIPETSGEYLVRHCMAENFGEIGVLINATNGEFGRLGYEIAPRLKGLRTHNAWLHDHIVGEWRKAHGQVPTPLTYASVTLKSLKDSMVVSGVGDVLGVKLTFEWQSASVECLIQSVLRINLPREARFRFLDLESRDEKPTADGLPITHVALNRRVVVVLQLGERLMAIGYLRGEFDANFPAIPITQETMPIIGNDKFAAMIEAIRG